VRRRAEMEVGVRETGHTAESFKTGSEHLLPE